MGKAAANIPSGMGEGLVRFTEGVINTPAMVVQGFATIGQLIKNPSISSDDLISTPRVHLGHVPAIYKDPHSMAAYNTMSVATQVAATVATVKLPAKEGQGLGSTWWRCSQGRDRRGWSIDVVRSRGGDRRNWRGQGLCRERRPSLGWIFSAYGGTEGEGVAGVRRDTAVDV